VGCGTEDIGKRDMREKNVGIGYIGEKDIGKEARDV